MSKKRHLFFRLLESYNRYRRKLGRMEQGLSHYKRKNLLVKRLQSLQHRLLAMKETGRVAGLTAALGAGLVLGSSNIAFGQNFSLRSDNVLQVAHIEGDSKPAFADWDGDGDLDLFIGGKLSTLLDSTAVGVAYYSNEGGRFFQAASPFPADMGTAPLLGVTTRGDTARVSPAFIGLDSDGDLDAFAGIATGHVLYYRNDGGTLVLANGAENPFDGIRIGDANDASPAFADVDGDGDLDAIFGKYDGLIAYYLNDAGTFVLQGTGANDPNPFGSVDVSQRATPALVDWDGDGDLDLFVGNKVGEIAYYINDGGVYTAADAVDNPFSGQVGGFSVAPAFADIDADGDMDAFVGEDFGEVTYLRNDAGAFTRIERSRLGLGLLGDNLNHAFVDIDSDGDLDLFSGSFYGNLNHFKNNDGIFSISESNPLDTSVVWVDYLSSPAFADIDGDGDPDAFVGSYQNNISYLRNDDGVFTAVTGTEDPFNGINAGDNENIAFVDWDGDGDLDAFIGNKAGEVKYFINEAGKFSEIAGIDNPFDGFDFTTVGSDNPAKPALTDWDGDGDLDAAVGKGNGDVVMLVNDGGSFSLAADAFPWNFVRSAAPRFADLDGDGDGDLVVSNATGHTYYFENLAGLVSAKETSYNLETTAYPNPTSDNVRLEMPWSKKLTSVSVYSATGQLIQHFKTVETAAEIRLNQLPAGLYVVRLLGHEGVATKRIWKM
ncbi:MAG: T9SS type A sorting domain-containing protein [Saprospiraceae bacterium]|nr:T9SS type A sorting domain-containing protein [Saprospiraceae bacterium]